MVYIIDGLDSALNQKSHSIKLADGDRTHFRESNFSVTFRHIDTVWIWVRAYSTVPKQKEPKTWPSFSLRIGCCFVVVIMAPSPPPTQCLSCSCDRLNCGFGAAHLPCECYSFSCFGFVFVSNRIVLCFSEDDANDDMFVTLNLKMDWDFVCAHVAVAAIRNAVIKDEAHLKQVDELGLLSRSISIERFMRPTQTESVIQTKRMRWIVSLPQRDPLPESRKIPSKRFTANFPVV